MSFLLAEDEALRNSLKGIYVVDEKNQAREVGVWFATPDVESRQQIYPYMTIELLDLEWARYRQQSGRWIDNDKQGTVQPSPQVAHVYEMPVPWDLTYQVTTYARHPRHDRQIISHLIGNDFPANRGFLKVPNALGNQQSYRHLILDGCTKRDMVEDGRRLFRNVFTLRLTSESVSGQATGVPEVRDVFINTNPTNVPDDFTIV